MGVVLAAGAGTRLGHGPKALLPFRGSTLVEHVSAVLHQGGCSSVMVVTGAGACGVAALQHPGRPLNDCTLIVNTAWDSGMGGSFCLGVATALAPNTHAENVLIALVDQPGISAALVARLLRTHRHGRVTAAGFRDGPDGPLLRGHPVVFSREQALEAAELSRGDAGAREYLRTHTALVDVVDCSDLTDGADIDTPADLPRLD